MVKAIEVEVTQSMDVAEITDLEIVLKKKKKTQNSLCFGTFENSEI